MSCEFNSDDIKNGQDINAQLLQSQFGPIETRLCSLEQSLQFLGNLFGKGVFNLDSQNLPGEAFNGNIISGGDEFEVNPGAAILDGFIIQKTIPTTLSFFGLNTGIYYVQLDKTGLIDIYTSTSIERVTLWQINFDGIIQSVVDERIFITNPEVLFNELITARNTQATIIGTKQETFNITLNTNDQLILSIDGKPDLEIILSANITKTANNIVTEINNTLNSSLDYGVDYQNTATNENGYIRLSSPGIGLGTSVLIKVATANSTLGFLNNEQSIGITYDELEQRLNAQEIKIQTDLKQHTADINIHHNKVHDLNGTDHTGSLDESKVDFDPINGHNHDGVNSRKITFNDIDVAGTINPFNVTLKQAESAGIIEDGQPQLSQNSTSNSNFVNDLVDPLLPTTDLQDDLNQIRSSIRQLKDPSQSFNTTPTQNLKDVSDKLDHITNGDSPPLIPGQSIIPNTLSHNNLIAGGGVGNPHQTNLQDVYDASASGSIQVTPSKPFVVGGATPSTQVEFNELGEINGINLTNHVNNPDAHHPQSHSHNGDGSGALDFNNLDYTGQLPLSSINDAQSATAFNIHNHDGFNSPKIDYSNLTGALDLTGIVTTGQLGLDKIEGYNGTYFEFPLDLLVNGNLTLNGDLTTISNTLSANYLSINNNLEVKGNVDLGDNGSNINLKADTINVSGDMSFTGDVTIGNDNSDSLTIESTTTFTQPVSGVSPILPNDLATKDYVDNNGGGGGGTASGVSYDNTFSGLTATNVQDAIDEIDSNLNNYLPLSGGTLSGVLTLDSDPVNPLEAATKQYVDNIVIGSGYVLKAGDTMTGDLTMSNQADINLGFLSKITGGQGSTIDFSFGGESSSLSNSQFQIIGGPGINYGVNISATASASEVSISRPGFSTWTSFTHAGNQIRGGGFWSGNGNGINLSVGTGQNLDFQTDAGYAMRIAGAGATNFITGGVTINSGNTISWADAPTNANHLTNKAYVDSVSGGGNYVAKTGDTMTGNLILAGSDLLSTSTASQIFFSNGGSQASILEYNQIQTYNGSQAASLQPTQISLSTVCNFNTTNITLSKPLFINDTTTVNASSSISWATLPTLNSHLANKQYVDSVAGGGTQFLVTSNTTPSVLPTSSGTDNISIGSSAVTSTGTNAIALGNSYASGNNSLAVHIGNNTSTYGAQGTYSVAIGQNNKATANNSIALGIDANATLDNQITHGLVKFNSSGDAQSSTYILGNLTTNNTVTSLYLDNAAATKKLVLPNDSAWTYEIQVIGRTTSGSLQVGSYIFKGCITKQTLNSSVNIINQVKEVISESNVIWDTNVIANTSDGSLDIQVTGDIATNIRWVATVKATEVRFP